MRYSAKLHDPSAGQPTREQYVPPPPQGISHVFSLRTRLLAALFISALLPAATLSQQVVAYCAQDQVYSEPLLRDFEKQTGIRVLPVFDSEAVKTVGLANRLIAERANPRCDVFWGNEEMRTRQLLARGVFQTNQWARFGARTRRIVINTNLLSFAQAPKSLMELTNQAWRGKVTLAYPQFGATSTHFHALRQHWGANAWRAWCRAIVENKALLVDGNSTVVRVVGRGDVLVGLTDSDDISAGQREGLPVAALPTDAETLVIPNTVAITRGAPNPEAARKLFEYLQSPAVIRKLVEANALESVELPAEPGQALAVDWDGMLRDLESTTAELNRIFLR